MNKPSMGFEFPSYFLAIVDLFVILDGKWLIGLALFVILLLNVKAGGSYHVCFTALKNRVSELELSNGKFSAKLIAIDNLLQISNSTVDAQKVTIKKLESDLAIMSDLASDWETKANEARTVASSISGELKEIRLERDLLSDQRSSMVLVSRDIGQGVVQSSFKNVDFVDDNDLYDLLRSLANEVSDVYSILGALKSLDIDSLVISKLGHILRHLRGFYSRLGEIDAKVNSLLDTSTFISIGLFSPEFRFLTSSEYKSRLNVVREQERCLVRMGSAVEFLSDGLAVGGSKVDGKKLINATIKHTLLTFNNVCDAIISGVKYGKYDSGVARIKKTYEDLNKFNATLMVVISGRYLELKLGELSLAYEYELKKQEEKEYQRQQREAQREAAKVQKEIDEKRDRLQKELRHYSKQFDKLSDDLKGEDTGTKKAGVISERLEVITEEIEDIKKALQDVDYREANQRAGYVYIISNLGAFGEGVFKIGMTRRLDPMDRIDELSGASVPFRFDVHALIFSEDAPALENALHRAFEDRRVNMMNNRKEFFRVSLEEIEQVVVANHDQLVDFNYEFTAQQYRETLALLEQGKAG